MKHPCVLIEFISVVCFATLCGCGRNSVSEVSVQQSGVEIVEPDVEISNTDWPGWRGPTGDGVAVDQPLLTEWDESTNVVWRTGLPGRGHSSPVVVGDSVYLATALEDQEKQQAMALDRQTGDLKWIKDLHSGGFPSHREMHNKSTHANGTIACDGKRLYIAFLNSDSIIASALDFSGEVVWQRELGKFS